MHMDCSSSVFDRVATHDYATDTGHALSQSDPMHWGKTAKTVCPVTRKLSLRVTLNEHSPETHQTTCSLRAVPRLRLSKSDESGAG